MAMVKCDVRSELGRIDVWATVHDTGGVPAYLNVENVMVTQRKGQWYLYVGVVFRDKEKGVALIEFHTEADSGQHRVWVPLTALVEPNGVAT